jgi:hypothetical protein
MFKICELLVLALHLSYVYPLLMHGSLFARCNLFFFFAYLRPAPAILTTQYENFACADNGHLASATISVSSFLGNNSRYFY